MCVFFSYSRQRGRKKSMTWSNPLQVEKSTHLSGGGATNPSPPSTYFGIVCTLQYQSQILLSKASQMKSHLYQRFLVKEKNPSWPVRENNSYYKSNSNENGSYHDSCAIAPALRNGHGQNKQSSQRSDQHTLR